MLFDLWREAANRSILPSFLLSVPFETHVTRSMAEHSTRSVYLFLKKNSQTSLLFHSENLPV
jgi:hypothetical protein